MRYFHTILNDLQTYKSFDILQKSSENLMTLLISGDKYHFFSMSINLEKKNRSSFFYSKYVKKITVTSTKKGEGCFETRLCVCISELVLNIYTIKRP